MTGCPGTRRAGTHRVDALSAGHQTSRLRRVTFVPIRSRAPFSLRVGASAASIVPRVFLPWTQQSERDALCEKARQTLQTLQGR
jgi:hypothetical protein